MAGSLEFSVQSNVGFAIIDNEARLNSITSAVMEALLQTCDRVANDSEIHVLVITGKGRAFCSGADIHLIDGLDTLSAARSYIARISDVYLAIEQIGKPTIAAVNGYALGGGFELCLACDLVIASDQATFALPEIRLGAIPGFAAVRLTQVVGRFKAAELMMLGDRISAADAERFGLVNRIVEHDRLMTEVLAIAQRLADGPPLALQSIKSVMRGSDRGKDMTLFMNTASSILITRDAQRGMKAFLNKDTPTFEGS